jgi:transposase
MLAMVHSGFRSLSPAGLLINDVTIGPDRILITARCRAASGRCPNCGRRSEQVHSRYERRLLDLPSHGRAVEMRVAVRRFRCAEPSCQRRIFAEPLGDAVAGRSARRTSRLEAIVHHLGIALGGRPAAALARRLMLPVSKDTLLRVVRRHAAYDTSPLCVIGIDDWAWKRGQRYGSIICDLERRQVVDLLADREPATVEAWLSRHPEVRVISRDRGGGYGQAATRAAPRAIQVADRWHLMENASAAFLEAVRRSMRPIRIALGSTTIDPALLTHAERLQHEGYLRRGRPMASSALWPRPARRLRRSCVGQVVAASWCARSRAAAVAMCSAAGRTFLSRILPGSTPNGRLAAATVPSCGGGFRRELASEAVCASSRNGQRGAGVPKAPDARRCESRRRGGC